MGRLSFGNTWKTPRSMIASTRFASSFEAITLSTRNSMDSPADLAAAFAFRIALEEMSVARTSKPRLARFIAWVAGPVPRSRMRAFRRRCSLRARSMSTSRSGLYHGSVATLDVAYSFSQSPVGPVAPGGSTTPRPAQGLAKALCLGRAAASWLRDPRAREIAAANPLKFPRLMRGLEKALDASFVIDVHAKGRRFLAESGHAHDVPREDDEESRAGGRPDSADLQRPTGRCAEGMLVVAQAELRLRDAHGKAVQASLAEPPETVQRGCTGLH